MTSFLLFSPRPVVSLTLIFPRRHRDGQPGRGGGGGQHRQPRPAGQEREEPPGGVAGGLAPGSQEPSLLTPTSPSAELL